LEQAKQAFERATELHKRQLIPQQTLDDADTMLRLKRAAYDSALQEAKNLRADIDASAAAMKLADRTLRDTSIRAPFDGYIQQRMVSLGELVKAQTPIMTVVRVDPLKLRSEIPERMAPWVKVGQPLTLKVDAFPDQSFTATISRISPAVTTQTRTFARMIASLIEEAEAIGWYEQRLAVENDKQARAIMANAQKEEFKHFGMDLEFLLRHKEDWRKELKRILFSKGDIVELGEEAEEDVD
jgi:hypothetical protein